MKRRDLLKTAAAFAATPIFSPFAHAINFSENSISIGPEKKSPGIAHFGDGRDWFFEKRYGMFVHWGL